MPSRGDFAGYQTVLDLWALEAYVQMLQVELPRLVESERQRIRQGVKPGDEEADYYADLAECELDEGITTRFLTGAALVAIWATYESVVKRNAERIRESRKLRLKVRDIKGANFLDSARKYYEDVLECELHPKGTDWERLSALYALRNALAHANGQLEDVPEADRKQVEKWATLFQGLKISSGLLLVSMDFVARAFTLINALLIDLDKRLDKELTRVM